MKHSSLLRSLPAIGVLFLSACATTHAVSESRGRDSGFLGTLHPLLEPDETGLADATWTKEGIDLSRYTRIMIDPGEVWLTGEDRNLPTDEDGDGEYDEEGESRNLPTDEDIAAMAKYGFDAARESLGKH